MATLSQVLVLANTYLLYLNYIYCDSQTYYVYAPRLTKTEQVTMTTIKQPVLIRKTIMTPNGLSLSLPDFKVNISKASKSSFEFYNKTKTVKRSL